jgi:flagellar hook protein FlgE
MSANGLSLSVVGDNIANMNTVGFKGSRVSFGDVLSQNLGTSQVGRGVLVSAVNPLFTQGSFENTASALDLAIAGDGFFILNDNGAMMYTRAGQFSMDKDGYIVNPEGLRLQGYLADTAGVITGAIGDLRVGGTQGEARMTASTTIALNLDAAATVPAAAFTLDNNGDGTADDPGNFNYSTTTTVYDSQGGSHDITLYFTKSAVNQWTVHYVHDDPANPGSLVEAGTQNLTFDEQGRLGDDGSGTAVNFNFGASVTTPQAITFNFGTGTAEAPPGSGLDGTTQFSADFSLMKLTQDGYGAGSLRNVMVNDEGMIMGTFSNGQSRPLGKVALARFEAPEGLVKMGRNLFAESFDSGQPIVGSPVTSGLGMVLSNSLELSNVDLAEEFVKMIAAQRGFQANSRVVTTSDELMQELVNLKR